MSKAEFVPKLAEAGKITKKQADGFLGVCRDDLDVLAEREARRPSGLGIFSVVDRKARTAETPGQAQRSRYRPGRR